ncbi:DUF6790 family protein [Francisella adeliensis]|uniref:Uncharacterized protein n=1 Tax=Francisella adeliensis TaxID=2007306 RepID=A0A2Z4XXV0_9GAMM|nr:DUF6790 family protein [Francisella adeliensis]AXA33438.1 hypothetical protein CDH04_02970 [Francisella adeliensis]MBK2085457.1 hypothetical protein [Francisella adeliensis]MBK2097187.1 hypothetical protein [Francisella adeliensis]QIW11666.1 hypothetical protein FZC43_02970 [Francisella adeliensis]QIW13541.1 hypothetical protein FZC44_02970 [Francisella adeliensis]
MIDMIITFFLSDVSLWTFVLALVLAFIHIRTLTHKNPLRAINLYLSYIFFLAVGMFGIWGFIMHCWFPNIAAGFIGWKNSPFQWEVGVANLAFGLAGLFACKASIGFQKSTVLFFAVFLWGAALGHIKQMINLHNFNSGNAGAIFWTDLIVPMILIILVYRKQRLLDQTI